MSACLMCALVGDVRRVSPEYPHHFLVCARQKTAQTHADAGDAILDVVQVSVAARQAYRKDLKCQLELYTRARSNSTQELGRTLHKS